MYLILIDLLTAQLLILSFLKLQASSRRNLTASRILGNGELTKNLTVKAAKFSAAAKEKIEKAGGKVEVM